MEDTKNIPNKEKAAFACCNEIQYLQEGLTKKEYIVGQAIAGQ